MPGRKPSVVRKLFSPVASVGKVKKMACHFCKTDNGKRMKDHILLCKKCPPDVMMKYCAYAAHSSGHSFEAIFASGAPLSLTENVYWQSAFNKIRPAYSLPSR